MYMVGVDTFGHTLDEDVLVAHLRDLGLLVELEGIEAALALYGPCLCRCWCHIVKCMDVVVKNWVSGRWKGRRRRGSHKTSSVVNVPARHDGASSLCCHVHGGSSKVR
jgi:hypothetical protein